MKPVYHYFRHNVFVDWDLTLFGKSFYLQFIYLFIYKEITSIHKKQRHKN